MKQLTRKQFLKRKVLWLAYEIHCSLLSDEDAEKLTLADVQRSFPKSTYYKSADTGEIRCGLSIKGIRKLVKKYPLISADEVKLLFNIGEQRTDAEEQRMEAHG